MANVIYVTSPEYSFARAFTETLGRFLDFYFRTKLLEEKRTEEEEKIKRIRSLAEELGKAFDIAPTQTYVLREFQKAELPPPELEPFRRPAIGEAFLPDLDKALPSPPKSEFVEVMKSPVLFQAQVLSKALPILAEASALGVNLAPLVEHVIEEQKKTYEAIEEERKALAELERKILQNYKRVETIAKRYNRDLSEEEKIAWATALAEGTARTSDLVNIFKKNVTAQKIQLDDGSVVVEYRDRNTGELVDTKVFKPDPELLAKLETARQKARQTAKRGRGTWKDIMVPQEIGIRDEKTGITVTTGITKVPLIVTINGKRYKVQEHSVENRVRLVPIDEVGRPIEITRDTLKKLLERQKTEPQTNPFREALKQLLGGSR